MAKSRTSALDRSTILALIAMAAGVFLIANDFVSLSVAIPVIEQEFNATLNRAQWVINGYTVVFGVLIVTGGRLADRFGRKRIFMIGSVIFAGFSVLGALAPNLGFLIGARSLMGIGGALVWPAVLGMTYSILPEDRAGLAGGLIIGVAGIGNALGPLLGGVLTDTVGWRSVFLLNLPITLIAMWIVGRAVPADTPEATDEGIDYLGIATLTAGVIAILVGLDSGTNVGFTDPGVLALFAVGVVLLVVFAMVEMRVGDSAVVPGSILKNGQFVVACLAILLNSAIFFAAIVYLPQLMEKQLGYQPIGAGLGMLPMMIVFALTSFVAGSLYNRLGAKLTVGLGSLALGGGMLLLSTIDSSFDFASLIPGMVVLGLGVGLFYSAITTAAVTALDPSQSSLAGGIAYMCQIAGGSLGLGFNTAIVLADSSFTSGVTTAFLLNGILAFVTAAMALVFIDGSGPLQHPLHRRHRHRVHAP